MKPHRRARKVMPVVLQELMRHDSIETTLRYYVRGNAELTAQTVWESCGATWKASKVNHAAAVSVIAEKPESRQPVEGQLEAVE